MNLWILLILIRIIGTKTNEILKTEKINILENKDEYKCKLKISEIKNKNKDINYIIFDFLKEKKNKRNEIYISSKENETQNKNTIYKLPLFGSNTIIIPFDYIKYEDNLYFQIICYKNEKCNEEIMINLYNKIIINEGETLYINGYKENYIYNFIYNYKNKKDENCIKQITAHSYQKNDFEFKVNNNNNNIAKIFNGYLYNIKNKEEKSDFNIEIKIGKPSAYIMLQIISIDNNKNYNSIELIRPIIGKLDIENNKNCFFIDEKTEEEYFIDFLIEDESHALILEYGNDKREQILFSQTIKFKSKNGKFCIEKFYQEIYSVNFYFTVYIPDSNDIYSTVDSSSFIRSKSFLDLLYNGYYYKKITKQSDLHNSYYPSKYNGPVLYFYLYLIRGIIKVSNFITNNFPFHHDEDNKDQIFKLLTINNIGNEYFGTVLINNNNKINSSPMDPNKNIFLVKCISGVHFSDEESDYCEYNIMFYTENDIVHLRKNEKFSYLNFDKINLKMDIFQNFNSTNNKLVIDLYTHFGSSYINILNKNVNTGLNTFYNGNLITNEIVYLILWGGYQIYIIKIFI